MATTLPRNVTHPCYHDEHAAREMFEAIRWPTGAFCPMCGSFDTVSTLGGESMGAGWQWCGKCRLKFTVRVGTVLERSHIALHKWLIAFRLYTSSKKGFSAHQLHRTLGIAYRSAWFMAHRIRLAMDESASGPLGGEGKTLEVDETFQGYKEDGPTWILHPEFGWQRQRAYGDKRKVVTLVERKGKARSIKAETVTAREVRKIVLDNADTKSDLMTDSAHMYRRIGRAFASHESVDHSKEEWARKLGDGTKAHTNTVEGYFSIFKRGMVGVYQHCSERHLHRYLTEFDFRYSHRVALGVDDAERSTRAIRGIEAKRLTYRKPSNEAATTY